MARQIDRTNLPVETDPLTERRRPRISNLPDISGEFGLVEDIPAPITGNQDTRDMLDLIEQARINPSIANVRTATDSLVSFPFADVFFPDTEVDRSSKKTLGSINRITTALTRGQITLPEGSEKIDVLRTQLEGTARRRGEREAVGRREVFLVESMEDARIIDERARGDVETAEAKRDSILDRIAAAESGENASPVILTSLRRQLTDAEESLRVLRSSAAEAGLAFTQARGERLRSLAPPGGGRIELEGGEVFTRGPERIQDEIEPGPEERQELARIAAESRARREDVVSGGVQPVEPDEAQKRDIRKDFGPRISAAKTFEEKRGLRLEMEARLAGRTTPLIEARRDLRTHDPIDAAGVPRTPELQTFVTKNFAGDIAKLEAIKRAMQTARGRKAAALQDRFDEIAFKLEDKIRAISNVQEERANNALIKAEDAFELAETKFAAAERRKDRDEIADAKKARDSAKATVDAAALAVKNREKAAALVAKRTAGKEGVAKKAAKAASLKTIDFKMADLDKAITKEQTRVDKLQVEIPELERKRDRFIDPATGTFPEIDGKIVTDSNGVRFDVLHGQLVTQISNAENELIQRQGRLDGFRGTPEAPGNIPGLLEKRTTLRKEREVIQSGQESTLEQRAWARSWRAANPEKSRNDFWKAFKDQFGFLPEGAR